MSNFKQHGGGQGGFKSGGRGFGRPSFGGNDRRDRGPVTMHEAVCAECGNRCEVPFRPSGDKPVYCSNCFGNKKGGDARGPRPEFNRPSFGPGGGDRGRDNRDSRDNRNSGVDIKRELEVIGVKLDQLIRSIDKLTENKPEPVAKAIKPAKESISKKSTKTKKKSAK